MNSLKVFKSGLMIKQAFQIAYVNNYGKRLNYTQYWQLYTSQKEERLKALEKIDGTGYSPTNYQKLR